MNKIDQRLSSIYNVRVEYLSPSKGKISRLVQLRCESSAHAKIEAIKSVVRGRNPTSIVAKIE